MYWIDLYCKDSPNIWTNKITVLKNWTIKHYLTIRAVIHYLYRIMEIKEFIKEVIGDITDAVIEINSEKCNSGVVVCPSRFSNRGEIYSITEDGKMVRNVDFNLSVVVSGKNEANAGLKISIARVGIGNETTNSTTSTISFSIPVAFPLEK